MQLKGIIVLDKVIDISTIDNESFYINDILIIVVKEFGVYIVNYDNDISIRLICEDNSLVDTVIDLGLLVKYMENKKEYIDKDTFDNIDMFIKNIKGNYNIELRLVKNV